MSSLSEALASLPLQTLGTVVHLGAGRGATLEAYGALRPRRLVLVEGDADAAAELRARARAVAGAEVVEAVVMPSAQTVSWQRYSLPSLDGPIEVTGLARYYPRLRRLGGLTVQGVALEAVLAHALGTDRDAAAPALLVIDLPGQEAALLEALPRERLEAFDWVLLRGCSEAVGVGAKTLDETSAHLADHVPVGGTRAGLPSDPLWPVALLHLDRGRVALRRLGERLSEVEHALARRDAELVELHAAANLEREGRARDAADRQRQLDAYEAEAARLQRLIAERDGSVARLEAELAEMAARQHMLQEELVRAEAQTELIADLLLREVAL